MRVREPYAWDGGDGDGGGQVPGVGVGKNGSVKKDVRGTMFFIHGWPDNSDVFSQQYAYFLERGYRCISIDLPGFRPYSGEEKDVLGSYHPKNKKGGF